MKILVPTDFSKNADHALEIAKKIASQEKSTLTLLFAFYAVYDFASQAELIVDNIEQDAKKIMEEAVKTGISEGFEIDYTIKQGTVSTAVTSTAYQEDYDLIVMGTQGKNSGSKKIFGTNTGHVIQESKVPVLAVPEKSDWQSIKKITISTELKDEDLDYYEKLMKLAVNWNLPIEILHINKTRIPESAINFEKSLSFFSTKYPQILVTSKIFHSTEINSGISEYLKSNNDTVLVMFYKKKTFFEHLFNKSHSLTISYHTQTPLLIIH